MYTRLIKYLLSLAITILTIQCLTLSTKANTNLSIPQPTKAVTLSYDDRYTFNSAVDTIYNITNEDIPNHMFVTSYQCGTTLYDTSVATVDSSNPNKIIATGCGSVVVKLVDGSVYQINVQAAPISLFLLIGQSNCEGSLISPKESDKLISQNQRIINEEGTVYNTYIASSEARSKQIGWYQSAWKSLTAYNASSFLPSSLTDNSAPEDWKHLNNLTSAGHGKSGWDGAFAYRWHRLTGEKVWLVNASIGGTSIKQWQPGKSKSNNYFWRAVGLYQAAENLLDKEIQAGHYKLSHKGYFWLQGENDQRNALMASSYIQYFKTLHQTLMKELKGTNCGALTKEIEFGGIAMVRAGLDGKDAYSLKDVQMTNVRRALFTIAQSNESTFANVHLVCDLADEWTTSAAVTSYFKKTYGTQANYALENPTYKPTTMPKTVKELHPTIHYSQLGYNELGRDIASNLCYTMKYVNPPTVTANVSLYGLDGYKPLSKELVLSPAEDTTLVAKVFPVYLSKTLSWQNSCRANLEQGSLTMPIQDCTGGITASISGGKSTSIKISNTIPNTVVLKKATGSESKCRITWKTAKYATGYKVYRRTKGSKWKCIATISGASSSSYTDTSMKPGQDYHYTVRALNKNGLSSYNKTGITTSSKPSKVTNKKITKVSKGYKVSWKQTFQASGYYVYRRIAKGKWTLIATIRNGKTTNYIDKSAKKNKTYDYTIRAYNSSGKGPAS